MTIPATVRAHLRQKGGRYKARMVGSAGSMAEAIAEAQLPPERVALATLLTTGKTVLMVIHPASHKVDLAALAALFRRPFSQCSRKGLKEMFPDCDPEALPPLPNAYGVKAVIDESLADREDLYFPPGRLGVFVHASGDDYAGLAEGCWVRRVSAPGESAPGATLEAERARAEEMRARILRLQKIPAMPGMAAEIRRLRNNPYAHVSELAAIIEQDPSLSAQILRYASSPFFGYQGKVDSVALAISRVLGIDFVMDLAFGLSLARTFRRSTLGAAAPAMNLFWRHASYAAALTQALCLRIPYMRRPSPGMAYLSGLLHNFGTLLLAEIEPDRFIALYRTIAREPGRSALELEREMVGATHMDLGSWLMEEWRMPREIVDAVREHHNPRFQGDFAVYPNLVCIANFLLRRHGIGDAEGGEMPQGLLEAVGLDPQRAEEALDAVLGGREGLEFMARKMA